MTRLIGICGYARSGKDSIANVLVSERGFKVMRFATPLKAMLRALLEAADVALPVQRHRDQFWFEQWLNANKDEVPYFATDRTMRELLQTLGTEWGRELINEAIWVRIAERNTHNMLALGYSVVWPDVRFPNEARQLAHMGGELWHVRRPNTVVMNHESEAHVAFLAKAASKRIINDGTLEQLRERVLEEL